MFLSEENRKLSLQFEELNNIKSDFMNENGKLREAMNGMKDNESIQNGKYFLNMQRVSKQSIILF